MTVEDAVAELELLRRWDDTTSQTFKERVRALYQYATGKTLRKCNCKDIYSDALIEIYTKLNVQNKKKMSNSRAKLVPGVVLKWKSNFYTNANLTDDVARAFLEQFPMREDWFEVLPSAATAKEETPVQPTAEPKATATKSNKKKTAKKRRK